MKIKSKHRMLVTHLQRFIDDKSLTDEELEAFIIYQSTGERNPLADKLIFAQTQKELTIKMIYEEVFSYWANRWGWAIPLLDIILDKTEDKIFQRNAQQIFNTLETRGVQTVLLGHSQFSDKQKNNWIEARRRSCNII